MLWGLWEPGSGDVRSRVAAKAVAVAEASGDPRLVFGAHLAAFDIAIESADHVTAARSLAKIRATARAIGEPRLRWLVGLAETFTATMAGRLVEAESAANKTLELGIQIGAPDAFTFFSVQWFVIGTFGGRHDELFPLVEQAAKEENPAALGFKIAYGIICTAVGRDQTAREILERGMASGFAELPVDNIWTTCIIGYAILAIELDHAEAAAQLLPLIEPLANDVAFNGVTSQGPIAAYVGKLESLLGRHDDAEEHLRDALDIAAAFGWQYHRATTLFALAQARCRRLDRLDAEGRAWLGEASELCRTLGFRTWIPRIDELQAGGNEVADTIWSRID